MFWQVLQFIELNGTAPQSETKLTGGLLNQDVIFNESNRLFQPLSNDEIRHN
jgi:hypothetical protein